MKEVERRGEERRGEEITFQRLMVEMCSIQRMSPIWPMLRVRVEEKLVLISSSQPNGLAPQLCHLKRHMT